LCCHEDIVYDFSAGHDEMKWEITRGISISMNTGLATLEMKTKELDMNSKEKTSKKKEVKWLHFTLLFNLFNATLIDQYHALYGFVLIMTKKSVVDQGQWIGIGGEIFRKITLRIISYESPKTEVSHEILNNYAIIDGKLSRIAFFESSSGSSSSKWAFVEIIWKISFLSK
jgi:hypothetical protein